MTPPVIHYAGLSIYTTRWAQNFDIQCKIDRHVELLSSDVVVSVPQLDGHSMIENQIDSSTLFTFTTYSDDGYNTLNTIFPLGDPIYARIEASGASHLPSGIIWDANECIVSNILRLNDNETVIISGLEHGQYKKYSANAKFHELCEPISWFCQN